jgi:multidrug transporter EmrE-like cation transporter
VTDARDNSQKEAMTTQLAQAWWLILISATAGVGGQLALKLGSGQMGKQADSGIVGLVTSILTTPLALLGIALYGIGALAWIAVLRRMDLGYAYPFLALNFILVALVSWLILGEPMPALRWLGIGFICVGILVVAQAGA